MIAGFAWYHDVTAHCVLKVWINA